MVDGATMTTQALQEPPLTSRRMLALFGVLAVLWSMLSWFLADWRFQERRGNLIVRQTSEARQRLPLIGTNIEHVLSRLQGLAGVVASGSDVKAALATFGSDIKTSTLPHNARQSEWTRRSDLLALNRQLLATTGDMGVDIIWLMNASGDCVAASNSTEPTSFVGTNYADRRYFMEAQAGKRGRQYAIGRVTKVPGLFFSAPVTADGRFLGAVAIKNDLVRIAAAVSQPDIFVTDDQGVIILAADRSLEMRAVPGAAVHQMPAEQQRSRYLRTTFDTLTWDGDERAGGTVRVSGSPYLHIAARMDLPHHGIAVHILAPVKDIDSLRGDVLINFLLLSFAGIMLLALVFGGRAYLLRARRHRNSMETANEALQQINSKLDALTKVDPLTDCANRRHFQERLESEVARAVRYGSDCSLLMADLDFFKQVNDQHGHAAGDEALCHFVQIVRAQLRGQDELGRLGGEEFAVLMPESGLASAVAAAERIRCAVEAAPAQFEGAHIPLTASFGVAGWDSPAESAEALLQRADKALYEAKAGGRNRVSTAGLEAKPQQRSTDGI